VDDNPSPCGPARRHATFPYSAGESAHETKAHHRRQIEEWPRHPLPDRAAELVTSWNDADRRTQAEVVAIFDAALARLAQRPASRTASFEPA
jgi:hypothetical protein